MLLNLSDVLGEHHKTIEREIPVEMDSIIHETNSYPILLKEQLSLKIEHVKGRELLIAGKGRLVLEIPCDRCLDPVETEVLLDFSKDVDLDVPDGEQSEELDETNYIDGYELDVEAASLQRGTNRVADKDSVQ